MKKNDILCAVDFSESSIDAMNWAIDLAKKTQAKLTVMYCYRLIPTTGGNDEASTSLKRNIEEEATRKFREFEAQHLSDHAVNYRFIAEVGFYHFRIEMFLQSNPVGLLVIGGSIVDNFDEYKNLGFEKFISGSKVPILIVPHEREEPIAV